MRRGFALPQPQRSKLLFQYLDESLEPKREAGSAVNAATASSHFARETRFDSRGRCPCGRPQAFLRVPRGRLVSLFPPYGRLKH